MLKRNRHTDQRQQEIGIVPLPIVIHETLCGHTIWYLDKVFANLFHIIVNLQLPGTNYQTSMQRVRS